MSVQDKLCCCLQLFLLEYLTGTLLTESNDSFFILAAPREEASLYLSAFRLQVHQRPFLFQGHLSYFIISCANYDHLVTNECRTHRTYGTVTHKVAAAGFMFDPVDEYNAVVVCGIRSL